MAEKKKNNNKDRKIKVISINLSWLYLLLIGVILWMLFFGPGNNGANPQKVEWEEVQQMALDGDVQEIDFVRNDYEGKIKIRPDRLEKYADKFGGQLPKKSPHFFFLVSNNFNAEEMFGALNTQLPQESRFKLVMENNDRTWVDILNWLLWPVLLIVFWVFMFRGMGKNMGGPAGGGIFSVGKTPDRKSVV